MMNLEGAEAPKSEDKVDFISNLSDDILLLILRHLSTEELIRTSILSTRWRHFWPLIASVDIDCNRRHKRFEEKKFREFVHWVLAKTHPIDLDSFRLCCSNHYNTETIREWINTAVTRSVKQVELRFCPKKESKDILLPKSLMTCASLEELRLFFFKRRLSMPGFIEFPALRVLELNNVELFHNNPLSKFLINCPLLEDLSLINCLLEKLDTLVIECPKLKNLRIDGRKKAAYLTKFHSKNYLSVGLCGHILIDCPELVSLEFVGHIADHFHFGSVDSLKKAVIRPEDTHWEEINYVQNSGKTLADMYAGVKYVESLSVTHSFLKAVDFQLDLPNLKTLELTILDEFNVGLVIDCLESLPDLESLHLVIRQRVLATRFWMLDQADETKIFCRHVKRVEFCDLYCENEESDGEYEYEESHGEYEYEESDGEYEYGESDGEYEELDAAAFFLEHGDSLEEMVFSWSNLANYDEFSEKILESVSELHKASSAVKVSTLLRTTDSAIY